MRKQQDTLATELGTSATTLAALIRDHLSPVHFTAQKINEGGKEKLRRLLEGEPWQSATVLMPHPNPKAIRVQTQKEGGGVVMVDVWGKNNRLVRKGRVIRIRMEGGRWVSRDF